VATIVTCVDHRDADMAQNEAAVAHGEACQEGAVTNGEAVMAIIVACVDLGEASVACRVDDVAHRASVAHQLTAVAHGVVAVATIACVCSSMYLLNLMDIVHDI